MAHPCTENCSTFSHAPQHYAVPRQLQLRKRCGKPLPCTFLRYSHPFKCCAHANMAAGKLQQCEPSLRSGQGFEGLSDWQEDGLYSIPSPGISITSLITTQRIRINILPCLKNMLTQHFIFLLCAFCNMYLYEKSSCSLRVKSLVYLPVPLLSY